MANSPLPPGSNDPSPLREAIAHRLQARFEAIETGEPDVPSTGDPSRSSSPAQPARSGGSSAAPARGAGSLQVQLSHLNQQLAVLRDQLDAAFDEHDDRMDDMEGRLHLAETRASVAEARASVAETRAADAEARATAAHRRIDETLLLIHRLAPLQALPVEEPADPAAPSALDQLRQLTGPTEG